MPNHNHPRHPGAGRAPDRNRPPPIDIIPSPYNFVPLSDKVYFPKWAGQVSMDIPFRYGICGTFEIEVEAKTPLYIRAGGDLEKNLDFFRVAENGCYAIPGSSFKGMIRNVLEIASFGKIVPGVDDRRYGVRNLHDPKVYTSWMTSGSPPYKPTVRAAWLQISHKGEWTLYPCEFARVEQEDLENFSQQKRNKAVSLGHPQSGPDKYKGWGSDLEINCTIDPESSHQHTGLTLSYRKVSSLGQGDVLANLVFTGQPSQRKPRGCTNRKGQPCSRGKHMEFVFFDKSKASCPVPEHVKRDFLFIHSDDKNNPNKEWDYWQKALRKGGKAPVFYLSYEGKPQRNTISKRAGDPRVTIHSIGLAMMYRLPYLHSVYQMIYGREGAHFEPSFPNPDLAELIFGTVRDDQGLRGRVSFGTLLEQTDHKVQNEVKVVLGGPKPSYCPNYLVQKTENNGRVQGDYTTYMDTGRIRGWKRYPIRPDDHKPVSPPLPTDRQGRVNADVCTSFQPLPAGTKFMGTVHLHNLHPVELGALIWALTWGGKQNLRHSLGMARPLGYGSVKVSLCGKAVTLKTATGDQPLPLDKYLEAFVEAMDGFVSGEGLKSKWVETDQIRELLAMADPQTGVSPEILKYPALIPEQRLNEFVDANKAKLALLPYSRLPRERPVTARPRQPEEKPATPPLAPIVALAGAAASLKDKEFRKQLSAFKGDISDANYQQLLRCAKKRPDWGRREGLRDERDWWTELQKLGTWAINEEGRPNR